MKDDSKPTIILFCGLPGSGKTTVAKALEARGRGIRICTDDWQDDLGANNISRDFHSKLQKRLYAHTLELLNHGQSVILEDGLWMKPERDEKLADAKNAGASTELHYFDLDLDEIWSRLESRHQNLPRGAVHISREDLEKCYKLFEKPDSAELASFDKVCIHKAESAPDQLCH